MDGDESHRSQPSSRAGNADTGRGKATMNFQSLGSKESEWTNEKHNMFLNSVEESFVNQLFSSDYRRDDPFGGWVLRTQKEPISPSSSCANTMCFGQIKMQRRGHRENHKFENTCTRTQSENESHVTSEMSDQNFVDKDCDRDQGHGRLKVYYRRNNGWKH